jgi:hypothetical protein
MPRGADSVPEKIYTLLIICASLCGEMGCTADDREGRWGGVGVGIVKERMGEESRIVSKEVSGEDIESGKANDGIVFSMNATYSNFFSDEYPAAVPRLSVSPAAALSALPISSTAAAIPAAGVVPVIKHISAQTLPKHSKLSNDDTCMPWMAIFPRHLFLPLFQIWDRVYTGEQARASEWTKKVQGENRI